jgi:SAM domain (Sterile alpha motif)
MPSLPITFIKQDSNNSNEYGSYSIKQPAQNFFGGGLIKAESPDDSLISNFKNMQKNLAVVEKQSLATPQFIGDDSDESQSGIVYEDDEEDDITLSPLEWDCNDVIEFLKRSNCNQHCELFMKHKIDGKKLLQLSQNEIIQLLGMKVGPAIKVFDLIQQIKVKVAPFMNTVSMK